MLAHRSNCQFMYYRIPFTSWAMQARFTHLNIASAWAALPGKNVCHTYYNDHRLCEGSVVVLAMSLPLCYNEGR